MFESDHMIQDAFPLTFTELQRSMSILEVLAHQ